MSVPFVFLAPSLLVLCGITVLMAGLLRMRDPKAGPGDIFHPFRKRVPGRLPAVADPAAKRLNVGLLLLGFLLIWTGVFLIIHAYFPGAVNRASMPWTPR